MGKSSLAAYLSHVNSNDLVMDFAVKELIPTITNTPIVFGLNATDPLIDLYSYIKSLKDIGFIGINNYPTVGLFDGKFKEALEEEGTSFDLEVEAIKIANFLDMLTIAFVFDLEQARKMLEAQADIICVHLGLTKGGLKGAVKVLSLEKAKILAQEIFDLCDEIRPEVIKMIYGGPVKTPIDA